jgi:hypothetical protein
VDPFSWVGRQVQGADEPQTSSTLWKFLGAGAPGGSRNQTSGALVSSGEISISRSSFWRLSVDRSAASLSKTDLRASRLASQQSSSMVAIAGNLDNNRAIYRRSHI